MSEHPELPVFSDNGAADLTNGPVDEPTIPTAEILNVLEQLKASQSESSQTQNQSQPQSQSQSQPQDPPSEWNILHTSLSEKPYDPDGWRRLVEIAETGGDVEQIKVTYEALLSIYPNTVCLAFRCSTNRLDRRLPKSSAQIAYINHFLNPERFRYAESLFQRFLVKSPAVDLWKLYLSYIRFAHYFFSVRCWDRLWKQPKSQ